MALDRSLASDLSQSMGCTEDGPFAFYEGCAHFWGVEGVDGWDWGNLGFEGMSFRLSLWVAGRERDRFFVDLNLEFFGFYRRLLF
jgi:hypothetical protein